MATVVLVIWYHARGAKWPKVEPPRDTRYGSRDCGILSLVVCYLELRYGFFTPVTMFNVTLPLRYGAEPFVSQ